MTTGFSGNTYTGSNEPTPVERAYAEGYKAGRIVALREVGCGFVRMYGWEEGVCRRDEPDSMCEACRLLSEAESEESEVGGDR